MNARVSIIERMTSPTKTTDELLITIRELGVQFRARMRGHDGDSSFPFDNMKEAAEAGLSRLCVPKEWGGFGYWLPGNYAGLYKILEELAYWDSNTAQLLQVSNHAAGIIAWHGTPAQKARFLPEIVAGGYLASLGSEAHLYENGQERLEAELTKVDGGYRLTARKGFASVCAVAKYLLVWCAIEGDAPYASRLVFAVVPTDAPGVEILDDWQMLGMRSTQSCGIKFTDVFVPADDVVSEPGAWVDSDPRTFSLAYAANHIGVARSAFDFVVDYVRSRSDLSSSEAVLVRLGTMDAKLFAAKTALTATAARLDAGDDPDEVEADAVRTMHLAKEVALSIPYEGFDIVGARACHERYPLGQIMRDARTFTLHFRDDLYTARVAEKALGRGFSAKKGRGGSTPFSDDQFGLGQAHAGG